MEHKKKETLGCINKNSYDHVIDFYVFLSATWCVGMKPVDC